MKFISWNVNGLRAILKKNFLDDFDKFDADFVSLQETKLQEGQVELDFSGYSEYWNFAEKKGYSGTLILARHEADSVNLGIGQAEHDREGRVITLEYDKFFLVNVYTPNSQNELKRLDYRVSWEAAFREYVAGLDRKKAVIICGDLNVAHNEIDLANPDSNHMSAGFSDEERAEFGKLLDMGFTDSFRYLYPDRKDVYSWWSYRTRARNRNVGWRIDYFLTSERVKDRIIEASILTDVMGSDHCPVLLEMDI